MQGWMWPLRSHCPPWQVDLQKGSSGRGEAECIQTRFADEINFSMISRRIYRKGEGMNFYT